MAKLSVAQKTIKDIFENEKTDFLVPDYQRKYDWGESECERLWDDLLAFTFPDNDPDSFDSNNDEFFLGSIVTFNNENKQEIIDGQQRLVTFLLIFRAFYEKFINIQDDSSNKIRDLIERCIFKTDENFNHDKNKLKIESRVATESDNEEFLLILKNGVTQKSQKSNYAKNYTFFKDKIDDFLQQYPSYFSYFPYRILNNCILLHIETELQDTALRIFSTLNDRGKSLSDTDIFKSQLYKFFSDKGFKDRFNYQWKDLERVCEEIFPSVKGNPMNELFTRYMYFIRAKNANHGKMSFTNAALRKMYEKDGYSILRNEETFKHLIILAKFWEKVFCEDDDFFSEDVLRRLFVLNYSPNNMWNNLVSVYYLQNKDKDGKLNQTLFESFLDKITAFILTYTITNPGTNTLRIPVYAEMVNIIKGIYL